MPGKKQRVSVVRISRQLLSQTNSNDRQEETQPDSSPGQLKLQTPREPDTTVIHVKSQPSREPDPSPVHVKPQPSREPDSSPVHVKLRPPPERNLSPLPVKSQPTRETDASTVHVKPRSPQQLDRTPPRKKDATRRKTDMFTLDVPQTSDSKNEDHNLQTVSFSRPSQTIQHQPSQANNTWIKSTPHHQVRPELNWAGSNQWSHGLCEISDDCNMCCYAFGCWCCFRHEISTMMGEHWCLWFLNVVPLAHLRTKFRQQYSIEGSIAGDLCAGAFCPLCVALQLANEARDYGHRIFS